MGQWQRRKTVFLPIVVMFAVITASADEVDILFDMGPKSSPVVKDAQPVHRDMAYSRRRGYGWERIPQSGFNDESGLSKKADAHYPLHLVRPGKQLYQDGFEDTKPIGFLANVPEGKYLVTVYVGRYQHPRHDLIVRINGQLVADNIDAWGNVWGSQGGTPVKSVKAPIQTTDGIIRIEVDYEPSRPDSWKQYTTREPEDGRLWYLGKNKSSILGVCIRSAPEWPIERKNSKLQAPGLNQSYQNIISALNQNDIDKAISMLGKVEDNASTLDWIVVCDAIVGHIDTPAEKRIQLLKTSLGTLRKIEPKSSAVLERIEVDERLLTALQYMRMWSYSWAHEQTCLNGYHRYWAAYECCNPVAPDDPLYALSLLLKMRISYWNGREGGWKHCYDLARQHALALKKQVGGHDLVRMYLGESIRHVYDVRAAPANAPRWAVLQREALGRLRDVIHYWCKNRQSENGELGGGWGDDVEILRDWVPVVLATHDKLARDAAQKIADGVYTSGVVENGYSREIGDVEHAAEPVSDTQPLMMATRFAEPVYFERCLETMRCMRDVWTGRGKNGNLHFKSHYYSATKTVNTPPRSADVPLNGRAVKPGIWVVWYSGHPVVRQLLTDWSMAWTKAAESTDNGKPAGIIPGSVSFPDGRIGGYAEQWWQTKGYDDLTAMGYTAKLYHIMLACWAETGNEKLIEPMLTALKAIRAYQKSSNKNPQPGSFEWAGQIHDNSSFFDVVQKWRDLSQDNRFDDLILRHATGMTRFCITGDSSQLERELQGVINGLSHNLPMITTEVLFTDRVSIPGNTVLASMLTGSSGEPTYYPLHAVTWDGVGDDVAVFVTHADKKTLKAQLYTFADSQCDVSMRLWRLEHGAYELQLSEKTSPYKILTTRTFQVTEKGTGLNIILPSQRLLNLAITRKKSNQRQTLLPDLAVGARDIKLSSPGVLKITVHNLGTKDSTSFKVVVLTKDKQEKEIVCEGIPAPLDLAPKSKTFDVILPASFQGQFDTVRIDPYNEIEELYECNNET